MADMAAKADELRLKEEEQQARLQLEGVKLGMEAAKSRDQSGHQHSQRAVDFTKHREQMAHQKEQSQQQAEIQATQPKESKPK
jgi:hypothetical protein